MKTKIAVIGAGLGGLSLLKTLEKIGLAKETILIDPKDYGEVSFAVLRSFVTPETFPTKVRKPLKEIVTSEVIQGKVEELNEHSLILEDGRIIDFEYAVIASGSSINGFENLKPSESLSLEQREYNMGVETKKVHDAKKILIIGGGPVGVELAGEIADNYKNKEITLVTGPNRLLNSLSPGAGKKAKKVLTTMGVKVLTNQYLEPIEGSINSYKSKSGQIFEADLVYKSLGIKLNNGFMKNETARYINDRGQIKVDARLMVKGSTNLFALGDITDVEEMKLGAIANMHAKLIAGNLNNLINNIGKLKEHKAMPAMGFITLGHKKGIAQLPFMRMDPMIAIKQKDLFVSMYLK